MRYELFVLLSVQMDMPYHTASLKLKDKNIWFSIPYDSFRSPQFVLCTLHNSCSLCSECSYTWLHSFACVPYINHISFAAFLADNDARVLRRIAFLPEFQAGYYWKNMVTRIESRKKWKPRGNKEKEKMRLAKKTAQQIEPKKRNKSTEGSSSKHKECEQRRNIRPCTTAFSRENCILLNFPIKSPAPKPKYLKSPANIPASYYDPSS